MKLRIAILISALAFPVIASSADDASARQIRSARITGMCVALRGISDRGVHMFKCDAAKNMNNLEWEFKRQHDGSFRLMNRRGLCLAAKGLRNRAVHQWNCVARNPRNDGLLLWRVENPGGGLLFRLYNVGAQKCLAIDGRARSHGIHLWDCNRAKNPRNLLWYSPN